MICREYFRKNIIIFINYCKVKSMIIIIIIIYQNFKEVEELLSVEN